jgi:sec-independent protein translocase protein TatB
MDILGVGPMELLFIVLIALIVLGPKDMIKAGKTIGRTLRAVMTSDTWRVVNQASREIRNLPNRLMRESGIDELQKQLPSQSELSESLGMDKLTQSVQAISPAAPIDPVDLSPWTSPGGSQPGDTSPTLVGPLDNQPQNPAEDAEPSIAPPGFDNPDFSAKEESQPDAQENGNPPKAEAS